MIIIGNSFNLNQKITLQLDYFEGDNIIIL